jgi:hypothetical protein
MWPAVAAGGDSGAGGVGAADAGGQQPGTLPGGVRDHGRRGRYTVSTPHHNGISFCGMRWVVSLACTRSTGHNS